MYVCIHIYTYRADACHVPHHTTHNVTPPQTPDPRATQSAGGLISEIFWVLDSAHTAELRDGQRFFETGPERRAGIRKLTGREEKQSRSN